MRIFLYTKIRTFTQTDFQKKIIYIFNNIRYYVYIFFTGIIIKSKSKSVRYFIFVLK